MTADPITPQTISVANSPIAYPRLQRIFVDPIIFVTKALAFAFAAFIWVLFGPVWFAILIRTAGAFAVATVRSLFNDSTIPDPARLEYVASFWMRGFGILFYSIRHGASSDVPRPSKEYFNLPTEIAITIFLYAYVVVSLSYIQYWLPVVSWIFGIVWWLLHIAIDFVIVRLVALYNFFYRYVMTH